MADAVVLAGISLGALATCWATARHGADQSQADVTNDSNDVWLIAAALLLPLRSSCRSPTCSRSCVGRGRRPPAAAQGGEEFSVFLPEADAHQAAAVAERCAERPLRQRLPDERQDMVLSCGDQLGTVGSRAGVSRPSRPAVYGYGSVVEVLLDGRWVPGVAVQVSADGQRVKVRRSRAGQDPLEHWQDADVVRAASCAGGPEADAALPGEATGTPRDPEPR